MNKQIIGFLAIALAAGLVAYGVTRKAVCGRDCSPLNRLEDVSFLIRELELNAEQAAGIKRLQVDFGATLNDCCRNHCGARARLGQALANETADNPAPADALVAEMCRAYENGEYAALSHIRRVRDWLSPEQKEKFNRLIADTVCQACPACAARSPAR